MANDKGTPASYKDNQGNTYGSQKDADTANQNITRLADLQRQIDERDKLQKLNVNKGPGYEALAQTASEKQAGVTPPGYNGMIDVNTGKLLDQYKLNPFAGAASQKLRDQALSTGPSDFAKSQTEQQRFDESQQRGNVGLNSQQQQSQAQSALARNGGIGSGARTSLARSGARDAMMARQGVAQSGANARYGITQNDLQNRQNLLGTTADVERQSDLQNITSQQGELKNRATFDANRYNQQMQAWAAKQSADATRAAGGGGGKK